MTRRVRIATALAGVASLAVVGLSAPASAGSRPSAPSSLQVVTKAPAVYLTWDSTAKRFVIEQSTDAFSTVQHTYKVRQPGNVFTPYLTNAGATYSFRVRAVNSAGQSAPSNVVTSVAPVLEPLRIMSYNSLAANQVGHPRPGGSPAPWSDRRGPQLDLIKKIAPNVMGIEEGANCLRKVPHTHCYRQIDSLMDGLNGYKLDATDPTVGGKVDYFTGNYIAYDNTVRPVGNGGTFNLGPSGDPRYAAYQVFTVVATGATFLFVDTHLLADANPAADKTRKNQTASMLRQGGNVAANRGVTSVIYAGDYNSYYQLYQGTDYPGNLMRAAGMVDSEFFAQKSKMAKYDSNNQLFRHARHGHGTIDHFYVSGGVGVNRFGQLLKLDSHGDFIGTIPSDHNPVYADLLFPS